jgi:hypothetical protein
MQLGIEQSMGPDAGKSRTIVRFWKARGLILTLILSLNLHLILILASSFEFFQSVVLDDVHDLVCQESARFVNLSKH